MSISSYSDLFHYAKGAYGKTENLISDLQVIVGHRAGVSPKLIGREAIIIVLIDAVMEHVRTLKHPTALHRLGEMLKGIAIPRFMPIPPGEAQNDRFEAVCAELVGYLVVCEKTHDDGTPRLDLGEPDPGIARLDAELLHA